MLFIALFAAAALAIAFAADLMARFGLLLGRFDFIPGNPTPRSIFETRRMGLA